MRGSSGIVAAIIGALTTACGGDATGPLRPQTRPPELGVYAVTMSGQRPNGSTWSRSFRVRLDIATRDSLVFTTLDGGDLPGGLVDVARLIDWGDRDHWHAVIGIFNAADVIISWYPDLTCEGRLFVDFGQSYPARHCTILRIES